MGYIYLQQPDKEMIDYQKEKDNKVSRYVDPSLLHIPLVVDFNRGKLLDDMRLSTKTYEKAVDDEQDAFVIIEVMGEYQIGLVKALLTRRNDLYPVEYLLAPQFILSEYTL
ncbi:MULTISPECIES: hypothetical protein [unclassified Brevibacillus]|uniref:hypothetical protein n=1 Tax=unclassified Brevibacillus TaxID=2684853 RepID=UPI00356282BD